MEIPPNKKVILFDGYCNLCDGVVQYVIRHDKKNVFLFASLQEETGQAIMKKIGLSDRGIDSIILYIPGQAYYYKSEAAFEIARELGGLRRLLPVLGYLPKFITDGVYDYVARNRYKWYGKKDACMIPTEEIKSKFI
jgi:predicted DCC family thiol-disulfide oxidoreductase YuxK